MARYNTKRLRRINMINHRKFKENYDKINWHREERCEPRKGEESSGFAGQSDGLHSSAGQSNVVP